MEEVKKRILDFKNWDDSKKGRALNRLNGKDLERFIGLPDDLLQATLDAELSLGLTLREAVACTFPLLEQRLSPRNSRSTTQPRKPRTFGDVLEWQDFLPRSCELFNGLDNTDRVYQEPMLVSDILPRHSIAPAADEAEVRGLIVRMLTSINTTASILGIPMECCSGGSGKSMSFTDLLVRPAGAQSDPNSLSSQVFGAIEVKGDWEFQLEWGERLEDALHDPERNGEIVQAIQQVYGDAVMDEAPLLILTNYHVTISLRRSYDVQDNRLWASEPIWFDQSDPPSRACWVYALQQAEELRELKRRLPRAAVPPTIEGCHIKPRQQQAHRQRQQIAAEQQAAEASSAGSSKRQCTEEQQPYVHGSSAHPAWERTAEEQAGEPSSSGRPLRRRRARSSTGRGYKGTEAHFPPEAQPAAASLSPPEVQEMVSLSELGLTDELLGAGQFGYTFKGSCKGTPVAVKVYNLEKRGAVATYEHERMAYGELMSLQGVIIPHLVCSGLLQHTAAPVIVTSLEGNAVAEDKRVPRRLHKPMRKVLQALHDAGAAHGDVRRSNFLVGNDGKVWLIDLAQTALKASMREMDADKQRLKAILPL